MPGRDSVVTFAAAAQTQDETRFLPVAQTTLELNAPDRALSVSRRLSPRAHSGCRANWKLDQAFSIAADRYLASRNSSRGVCIRTECVSESPLLTALGVRNDRAMTTPRKRGPCAR